MSFMVNRYNGMVILEKDNDLEFSIERWTLYEKNE